MLKDAHKKDINSLNWNQPDTRLISAGSDYIVNIYCTKQCEILLKINLHKSPVMTAVYHPKTSNIYSAGIDNWVGIWNENGQFV